jgi:hypothetical protein
MLTVSFIEEVRRGDREMWLEDSTTGVSMMVKAIK